MATPTRLLTVADIAALGLAAYAVYFDYQRRNNVDFRKKLKKEKKLVSKSIASSKASLPPSPGTVSAEELREALELVKGEQVPASPTEKEGYFMTQVASGEQLSLQGPLYYLPSALAFYRALRVYPSPTELIVIYQKTVPEAIFKIIIELMNLDVKDRVEGYYQHFPPASFGVKIESRKSDGGEVKKVVVLTKDVKAGDVIYQEHPIVSTLSTSLQSLGTHCSHCLRKIEPSMALSNTHTTTTTTSDSTATPIFPTSYCSTHCLTTASSQHHNLLFTLERPLPPQIPMEPITESGLAARRKAQEDFAGYILKTGRSTPLLVARFIARQVEMEMRKLIPDIESATSSATPSVFNTSTPKTSPPTSTDYTNTDSSATGTHEYLLADHFERLRFIDPVSSVSPDIKTENEKRMEEEVGLVTKVLETVLPGLDAFVTDERYKTLVGKMMYNTFGVVVEDGTGPGEDEPIAEPTRTPHGPSQKPIGTAIYTLSSYLPHSCLPNSHPTFPKGTSELHLIASQDLKKGDELTIAYVDVTLQQVTPNAKENVNANAEGQDAEVKSIKVLESVGECRKRRRKELARGWRFACFCERCVVEAQVQAESQAESEADSGLGLGEGADESKVEKAMQRFEDNEGPL